MMHPAYFFVDPINAQRAVAGEKPRQESMYVTLDGYPYQSIALFYAVAQVLPI